MLAIHNCLNYYVEQTNANAAFDLTTYELDCQEIRIVAVNLSVSVMFGLT